MQRRLIAVAAMLMAGAVATAGCAQNDGSSSQQTNAGSSGGVQTQTQGYGSDYEPMQTQHHR
jgi:hypothetical protein